MSEASVHYVDSHALSAARTISKLQACLDKSDLHKPDSLSAGKVFGTHPTKQGFESLHSPDIQQLGQTSQIGPD